MGGCDETTTASRPCGAHTAGRVPATPSRVDDPPLGGRPFSDVQRTLRAVSEGGNALCQGPPLVGRSTSADGGCACGQQGHLLVSSGAASPGWGQPSNSARRVTTQVASASDTPDAGEQRPC